MTPESNFDGVVAWAERHESCPTDMVRALNSERVRLRKWLVELMESQGTVGILAVASLGEVCEAALATGDTPSQWAFDKLQDARA